MTRHTIKILNQLLLTTVAFILFTIQLNAQVSQYAQVIPPSPTSMQFNKYLNYKVTESSGIPNITIPLYTIKTGNIEIPIELSYHASGIKYRQDPGEVGIGWSINPGYRVSRTIHGRPDDHASMPADLTVPYALSNADRDEWLSEFITNGASSDPDLPNNSQYLDGEFDLFTYSMASGGGYFIIKDRTTKNVQFIANENIKVDYTKTSDSGIVSLDLWDANGIYYRMGKSKVTGVRAFEYNQNGNNFYVAKAPTAWMVTDIEDPYANYVRFGYKQYLQQEAMDVYGPISIITGGHTGGDVYQSSNLDIGSQHFDWKRYYTQYISYIVTKDSRIDFTRDADGNLQKIVITDLLNNNPIKTVDFYNSGSLRFLDSVKINANTSAEEVYRFNYENKSDNPNSGFITDYWGYYKKVPTSAVSPYPDWGEIKYCANGWEEYYEYQPAADRTVSAVPKYFMLNRIGYPTGGYTEFEYESNKYLSYAGGTQSIRQAGVRIKQVRTFDGDSPNPTVTCYKYNESINTGGVGECRFDLSDMRFYKITKAYTRISAASATAYAFRYNFFNTFPDSEIQEAVSLSQPIFYREISIYRSDGAGINNGKTVYNYSNTQSKINSFGFTLNSNVSFIINDDCAISIIPDGNEASYISSYDLWADILTDSIRVYKRSASQYDLVNKEVYRYSIANPISVRGVKVRRFAYSPESYTPVIDYYSDTHLNSLFDYANYSISCAKQTLEEKIVTEYPAGTAAIQAREAYEYNNHVLLAKTTQINSKGEKVIQAQTYPFDYPITGTPTHEISSGVRKLQSAHVVNAVVEKIIQKSNIDDTGLKTTGAQLNVYKSGSPLLSKVYELDVLNSVTGFTPTAISAGSVSMNSGYKERLSYPQYDSYGNLLVQLATGGPSMSYLWGYKGQYPIAEVKNAVQADIAYGGFESDGKGNWTYSGATTIDGTAPTGQRVYHLAGGSLQKTGLTASRKYLLTYWSKGGAPTVAGSSGSTVSTAAPMRSRGNWTQYSRVVSQSTAVTISGTSGRYVDDVRLHPVEASMDSYTYDPLVGMTSHTDASGNIFYYQYDGFGRLEAVKDLNGHLVEDYRYHYRNQ